MENCGKIIEKNNTLNLVVSGRIRLIQLTQNPKKVSYFFIMIFQRYFSPILAHIFGMNLLTSPIVKSYPQIVYNSYMSTDFQLLQKLSIVDNLLTV